MNESYALLEEDIRALSRSIQAFTELELAEVETFLSAGEYGVAFETTCAIIQEEAKVVPDHLKEIVRRLALRLGTDETWWRLIAE